MSKLCNLVHKVRRRLASTKLTCHVPSFCANEHDTLGAWQCSPVGNDLTYAYGHWTNITILDDLVSRDLLYGLGFSYASFNTENKYTFGHLVGWSSSSFDGSGAVFNVKASVDTTAGNSDNKVMHSMYCTMNATGLYVECMTKAVLMLRVIGAEAINAAISSATALGAWTMFFQGYMYNGFDTPIVTNPEETLAWYLNSMIMVGGSSGMFPDAKLGEHKWLKQALHRLPLVTGAS